MSDRPRCIVFRLEFGGAAGWGHLARCSALAAEMRARGWTCVAWTDGDLAAVPDDLRAPFTAVLPASGPAMEADWIVVDHYGYADAGLRALRALVPGARMLVMDDDAVRGLDAADVVVNARLGLESSAYQCRRALLGERYALLRAGLRCPAPISESFAAGMLPVLVMLGGTDPRGLTAVAVEALADVDVQHLVPIVVRSRGLAGDVAVERALRRFSTSVWMERVDASTLAGWAGVCRYAVSACGGALYELAYLGLPLVGVVVAENQRAMAREVEARWHLPIVDGGGSELRTNLIEALHGLIAMPIGSRTPFGGIDGLGAVRCADVIVSRSRRD